MSRCLQHVLVCVLVVGMLASNGLRAQQKAAVPGDPAEQASRQAVGELYGGRFRQAKTTAEKTAVAKEMIDAALKVEDGSADQFVLLKISRDVASGIGDATTVLRAVEVLVQRFDVPGAKLTAESLLAAANRATASSQQEVIAEAAARVVAAAAEAEEYDLAVRLCEAARSAAQKCRKPALARPLTAKLEDLKQRQKAFQEYRDASAVLATNPREPEANLAAGRYLCLIKGDWTRGVALLALGSDSGLKAAAARELQGTPSAAEQVALGDQWWALAETKAGVEKESLLLRAAAWYRRAEPGLTAGLARLKITNRLAEVAKLGRELPPLGRDLPPPAKAPPPAGDSATLRITKDAAKPCPSVTSSLAFSPDGRTLLACGLDKDVMLVEVPTLRLIRTLRGHADIVRAVAFSADGQLVASGDMRGSVKLWKAATGETIHTLPGHPDKVFAVAFAPDGRLLASAGWDFAVRLWDVAAGREHAVLRGHKSWVWTLDFSPDGKWLASAGGADNTARVWSVATAKELTVFQEHTGKVRTVRFLPGGQQVLSSADDRTVRFWNPQTGQEHRTIRDEQGTFSADVSPDGRTLVTGGGEGVIKFWDIASGRLLHTDRAEPAAQVCWGLRFAPTGRHLALGGEGRTLQLWTLAGKE